MITWRIVILRGEFEIDNVQFRPRHHVRLRTAAQGAQENSGVVVESGIAATTEDREGNALDAKAGGGEVCISFQNIKAEEQGIGDDARLFPDPDIDRLDGPLNFWSGGVLDGSDDICSN